MNDDHEPDAAAEAFEGVRGELALLRRAVARDDLVLAGRSLLAAGAVEKVTSAPRASRPRCR